MQYVFILFFAVLGFVAGEFLAMLPLITITVVSIFIGLFFTQKMSEIGEAVFCIGAIVFNLAMWVVYFYMTTGLFGLGDFIRTYILR